MFLEKGAAWFSKNFLEIEKIRKRNAWWQRNTEIFEEGQKIKLSEFLKRVAELGYSKVWEAKHKGEFSQRGGAVHIFPINSDKIYSVEFTSNFIEEIIATPRSSTASSSTLGFTGKKPGVFPSAVSPALPARLASLAERADRPRGAFLSGDYVVHIDHGIGIYRGTTRNETQNDAEFIIEYAPPKNRPTNPDLLYVPITQAERIQPYLGFKKPEIHRLGTPIWEITKKRAKEDIIEFAKELIKSIAERKISKRVPYARFPEEEEKLATDFSFEYTEGQKRALEEVLKDMSQDVPMDRIITGDVGFGKTEIALVSAYRAVLNKKQVAMLAPTTILVEQHYELFKKRLGIYGVEIVRLSRILNAAEVKKISQKITSGAADIVIGTHKLLGKSINFQNMGLLIIDEEQKFGVSHKEKFSAIGGKTCPDILTLSATPIPRTLNAALSGLKQISQIETAPAGRRKVKTFVFPKPARGWSASGGNNIVKEAINFELERNGQIYFLANRIHNMPRILDEIKSLKTKVKIGTLHGRMGEKAIVKTMRDFREGKIDLLLSTTIIENGLDLSNANTLLVEDATKLGLSQAHQLRGRIGRGEKEAYAYFLYPTQRLQAKAANRLEALERYSWLGAGVEIAKRDLELRGAGNILGKAQSGVAYRVGLNLYFQLLEETIEELKSQKATSS